MHDKHFYAGIWKIQHCQWKDNKNFPKCFWNFACIWWAWPIWHFASLDSLWVDFYTCEILQFYSKRFRETGSVTSKGWSFHSLSLDSIKPTHLFLKIWIYSHIFHLQVLTFPMDKTSRLPFYSSANYKAQRSNFLTILWEVLLISPQEFI